MDERVDQPLIEKGRSFKTAAVEMAGRNWLVAKLLHEGLEVAIPSVDRGIDLIAFREVGDAGIQALPLQLKCAEKQRFSLRTKYENRGILLVYIWNVFVSPEAYILNYKEAEKELGARATGTDSWNRGHYVYSRISPDLQRRLDHYKNDWDRLRRELDSRAVSGQLSASA